MGMRGAKIGILGKIGGAADAKILPKRSSRADRGGTTGGTMTGVAVGTRGIEVAGGPIGGHRRASNRALGEALPRILREELEGGPHRAAGLR